MRKKVLISEIKNNIKDKLKLIFELLRNQYSISLTKKEKISNALSWGIKVFMVLFLLRPFGISDESIYIFIYTCIGFGLITSFVFIINNFTIKSHLYRMLSRNWYTWHELLYILLLFPQISILNYLFYLKLDSNNVFSIYELFKISFYTIDIIFILFFINIIYYLVENYKKESTIIQTKLEYYIEINKLNNMYKNENDIISLHFEKQTVNLQKNSILYVSAWENYIKIYVYANNELIQIIKRGKFKETVKELSEYSEFFQCHRSYIINLKFVKKITGTNKKLVVVLTDNIKIPVSRENSKPLRELVDKIQNHLHSISSL